jgi:hypothetical protein
MAATLVRKVMLKITADDGTTEEKLDRIKAKADELGRDHPELKVRINSAQASAQMAVLRKELKDTGQQASSAKSRFGSLGGALNAFTLGLSGGWGEMSMFGKVMAGVNIATGVGEPLMAGLTVTVAALASSVASAGLGLGVFGLVAKSVYSKVSTSLTGLTTAQKAYAAATTKAGRASALKAETTAMAGLTGSQRQFATALTASKNEWSRFVNAASPGVTSVMAAGMRLMPAALGLMKPFLDSINPALKVVIANIKGGLSSGWAKSFASSMAVFSGPALVGLSTAIGNVIKGIAGILKAFIPVSGSILSGLDRMTAKFATWGTTLGSHSGFQALMKMFHSETPLAVSALKSLAGIIKTVAGQMTGMSTFGNSKMFLQLATAVLSFANGLLKAHPELVWLVLYLKMAADGGKKLKLAFDGIQGGLGALSKGRAALSGLKGGFTDAEVAASDASGVFGTFGGKLSVMVSAVKSWGIWSKIAAAATKVWTGVQAAFDFVMDANPIGLIVIGIAALVAAIVICTIKFKSFRDFWKDLWKVVQRAASDAWHLITATIREQVAVVRSVLDWFGHLGTLFHGWWNSAVSAVESVVGRLVGFVRSVPGKIRAGLGDLGHLLWSAGESVMQGLIGGIGSMVGSLVHQAASIGSSILGAVKGALGIGSPSKEMIKVAGWIGRGLIEGLNGTAAGVAAGGTRIAEAISTAIHDGIMSAKSGAALKKALMAQIAAARQYSQQLSASAVSGYDITGMTNASGSAVTSASGILGGLKIDLAQIKAFTRNMKKLGHEGLNRTLLQQLFAAGPIQGGPVAAALAGAGLGEIRQISREESAIQSWSNKLGGVGATAVYGGQAGVQRLILQVGGTGGSKFDQLMRTYLKEIIRKNGGNPGVIGR